MANLFASAIALALKNINFGGVDLTNMLPRNDGDIGRSVLLDKADKRGRAKDPQTVAWMSRKTGEIARHKRQREAHNA